jgi:methyltransferase
MTPWRLIIAAAALQRVAELAIAARNTRRLRRRGAIEIDAGGYKHLVLLHTAWLAGLALLDPPALSWPPLALYAALQPVRVWAMVSLGGYWTTRLLTLPGAPVVACGPYRYLRHPNYLVVIGEVAALPLAAGAAGFAIAASAVNLALIARRVRYEAAALADRRRAIGFAKT